jgi:trans-aconitate methyltransferase
VLDAGCGLGHGLRALRGLWPQAVIRGVEWSPLLAWLSRRLCPWAQVQQGDMWALSWSEQDLVYVFQRPESMARVWAKACADMTPGSCLVSLEFAVPGQKPVHCMERPGQRPVWIYRVEAVKPPSITPSVGR